MKISKYNIYCTIKGENYIYNSVSKAFVKLNDNMHLNADNGEVNIENIQKTISKEDFALLIDNGYIVDDNYDELKALEYIYKKSYFDTSELTLILTPTFECNFACPYCFEEPQRGSKYSKDYFNIMKKFAERYFKFYRHVELSMFGGEPMLLFQEYNDMLNYTHSLSSKYGFAYSTSVTTNGSLLNSKVIKTILYHNCKSLQITLDGNRESHNQTRCFKDGSPSFDKLIKIINEEIYEYLNADDTEFYLRINLKNNSIEEIRETLDEINKDIRGKIYVVLRAVYSTEMYSAKNSNSVDRLMDFYDMASELGFLISKNKYYNRSCEACCDEKTYFITPDLGVWKCINNMSFDYGKIGEISNDGDFVIDANKIINWYSASDCFADEKCKNCKRLPDCFGGCILYNAINGKRKCTAFDMSSLAYFYN